MLSGRRHGDTRAEHAHDGRDRLGVDVEAHHAGPLQGGQQFGVDRQIGHARDAVDGAHDPLEAPGVGEVERAGHRMLVDGSEGVAEDAGGQTAARVTVDVVGDDAREVAGLASQQSGEQFLEERVEGGDVVEGHVEVLGDAGVAECVGAVSDDDGCGSVENVVVGGGGVHERPFGWVCASA